MRIYGGHDYYDCGLSLGIDPSITLVRGKSKSVSAEKAGVSLLDKELLCIYPEQTYSIQSVAVAFCAKVYFGGIVTRAGWAECFWSAEKMRAWTKQARRPTVSVARHWHHKPLPLEEFFEPKMMPAVAEYMIRNKYSILVQREPENRHEQQVLQINPATLKGLGFAKALDPYTAFQELSMWIGGVLGGTSPEIVTITDDKVLAEAHGYDKHSFRGPRI